MVGSPLLSFAGVKRARLVRMRHVARSSEFDPLDVTDASGAAYVTLAASGQGVRAAATYTDGGDWSTVPLAELPATVVRPAVSAGGPR